MHRSFTYNWVRPTLIIAVGLSLGYVILNILGTVLFGSGLYI